MSSYWEKKHQSTRTPTCTTNIQNKYGITSNFEYILNHTNTLFYFSPQLILQETYGRYLSCGLATPFPIPRKISKLSLCCSCIHLIGPRWYKNIGKIVNTQSLSYSSRHNMTPPTPHNLLSVCCVLFVCVRACAV